MDGWYTIHWKRDSRRGHHKENQRPHTHSPPRSRQANEEGRKKKFGVSGTEIQAAPREGDSHVHFRRSEFPRVSSLYQTHLWLLAPRPGQHSWLSG